MPTSVYRMGNGSNADWRFYSVELESTGGFGVEWQYENQRFVQLPSLGSRTNWQVRNLLALLVNQYKY